MSPKTIEQLFQSYIGYVYKGEYSILPPSIRAEIKRAFVAGCVSIASEQAAVLRHWIDEASVYAVNPKG